MSTLYTAWMSSLVGYGIFNSLLARHPVANVVSWILLVPVFAMASAFLVLGDRPRPAEVLGGCLLVGGVLAAVRAVGPAPSTPAPALAGSGGRNPTVG